LINDQQTIVTDSAKLMGLCIDLCNLSETHRLPSYAQADDPWKNTNRIRMSNGNLDTLFSDAHKNPPPPPLTYEDTYAWRTLVYPNIGGLGFYENWTYDPIKKTFSKQVHSVSLSSTQWIGYRESFFFVPAFCLDVPLVTDTAAIMKPEFLVAKNMESPVKFNTRWSTGAYEDNSSPVVFTNEGAMEMSVRYSFMQAMINDALAGKIPAYDGVHTDTQISPSQLQLKIDSLKDSAFVATDLASDYLLFSEIIFVEDWYFNPATGAFYKKVNSIIFVKANADYDPYNVDLDNDKRVFCIKMQ